MWQWLAFMSICLSSSYYYLRRKHQSLDLLYWLYANSRLGQWLHTRALSKATTSSRSMQQQQQTWHHSGSASVQCIPFLEDNYAYLLRCAETNQCALVDPADSAACKRAVAEQRLQLTHVLTTHSHADHAGGNGDFPGVEVVGASDRVTCVTQLVKDGDVVHVGKLRVHVIAVPCHTRDSVAFKVNDFVFTGDFLFSAGAGKFFEGSALDFVTSAQWLLAQCPDSTLMFPGHEYTVSNLEFALKIDPENPYLLERIALAKSLRADNRPTIPSSLGEERHRTNLFLQAENPRLAALLSPIVKRNPTQVQNGTERGFALTGLEAHAPPPDIVRALRTLKDRSLPKASTEGAANM